MVFVFFCLTYITYCNALKVHPCCHKWQAFILFLWLNNIPHIQHIFFIDSFAGGHLDYFSVLAIVNNAAVNRGVHIYFPNQHFHFLQTHTQRWNCWIICSSVFNFLRDLYTVFDSNTYVVFGKRSIQIVCPFLDQIIFGIEFSEFIIYFGY